MEVLSSSEYIFWTTSFSALALVTLAIFLVYVLRQYLTLAKDLQRIQQGISTLSVRSTAPAGLSFSSPEVARIWQTLLLLASREKEMLAWKSNYEHALKLGSQLTAAAHETSSTAQALVKILISQTSPYTSAGVVILVNSSNKSTYIAGTYGISEKRIESNLLSTVDRLIAAESGFSAQQSSNICWGYQHSTQSTYYNFSIFGINTSLLIPIRDGSKTIGAIWLGLTGNSSALNSETMNFIMQVCEHSAASFVSAEKVGVKHHQQLEERNFLFSISHDLRAPGNTALYALQELMHNSQFSNETLKNQLFLIQSCIEDQQELVSSVLDYAKHQQGILTAHKSRHCLRSLMSLPLELAQKSCQLHGLAFSSADIPEAILMIDPVHFKRILGNLLTNAIKYTKAGQVDVDFRVIDKFLKIQIRDTGIGIPEDQKCLLFNNFSRLKNAENIQGTGLGLAMSKVMAELNHAQLSYRPNPEGGSIFELELPIEMTNLATTNSHTVLNPLESKTIVIADDDSSVCRSYLRSLSEISGNIFKVHSCNEIISAIFNHKPDLIVSDFIFNDGNLTEVFTALEAQHLYIPTIIISGLSSNKILSEIKTINPVIVLEKPVDRTSLQQTALKLLQNNSSNRN